MAKIAFNKLNAKVNSEVKFAQFNGLNIEVKQYLPIKEKMNIIHEIVEQTVDKNEFYYNPAEVELIKILHIVKKYTNISFTEKQEQDLDKLYDIIISSGLGKIVIESIPNEEVNILTELLIKSLDNFYKYSNSAAGILQTSAQSMDNIEKLKEFASSQDLSVLKDILSHLG